MAPVLLCEIAPTFRISEVTEDVVVLDAPLYKKIRDNILIISSSAGKSYKL